MKNASLHYRHIGSPNYTIANEERAAGAALMVHELGSDQHRMTLVASIALDGQTKQAISGHESNPRAQSMKDLETAFQSWMVSTSDDKRIVIYEGDKRIYTDRDQAIIQARDSGLAQFLAHIHTVPSISGEASHRLIAQEMKHSGVRPVELAAFYVVRSLPYEASDTEWNIVGNVYYQTMLACLEGFREFTDSEKITIMQSNKLPKLQNRMKIQVQPIIAEVNRLFMPALGGHKLFDIRHDSITLSPEFKGLDKLARAVNYLSLDGSERIYEIARINIEVRDRALFKKIITTYDSGECPFVVYGGSHIVCLEPALRTYVIE